jgi:hypothetical protein
MAKTLTHHVVLALALGFAGTPVGILCALAAGMAQAADGKVSLVADGRPTALIVLPAEADSRSVEASAAGLLSDHLWLMSGARLDVKRETELGAAAVVGDRLTFGAGKVPEGIVSFVLVGESQAARSLGLTSEGLGPGGILVKTCGNVLVLLGPSTSSDNGGTRHAVIELLEQLGVRYLWPGEVGRVIPKLSTIAVGPLALRFTPPIGQRHIRFMGMSDRSESGLARLQLTRDLWDQAAKKAATLDRGVSWGTWHRLGGSIGIGGGHAGAGLSGGWAEHGEKHPEWFALQADGTRDQQAAGSRWRLCKSNPELIEFVARSIIERVNKDPNLRYVSLCPNDGGYSSHCLCENCKKLDPPNAPKIRFTVFEHAGQPQRHEIDYVALTDRMVWYWNRIAERVARVHPELLFLVEAYSYWSTSPVRERLHSNFVLRYVPSGADGWEGWQQAGAKRIYWRPNILLAGRRDGKLHVMAQRLAETMRFMADRGMLATDFDSILHNWAVHGLNYYATARLTWNPYLTADEILDSYCQPGFGAGAASVRRYFLRAQEITSLPDSSYTPETLCELRSLLNAADRACGEDEAARARIAFLRMGLNFTELQVTLDAFNDQATNQAPAFDHERVERLLELNYLTLRDIARNHTLAIHTPHLMWATGDFARWSPIRGRGYRPPRERLDQVGDENFRLTGRENSLDEMLVALGLDGKLPGKMVPAP